jgi:hypothetical protein
VLCALCGFVFKNTLFRGAEQLQKKNNWNYYT